METKDLFCFDQTINKEYFCNFKKEKIFIEEIIERSECVKLYGPRNFGKTSLAKNIVGKEWEQNGDNRRILIYADFYSVTSLEDISNEITKAFNLPISSKKNFFEKSIEWFKYLKKIRPTWSPPTDGNSVGEFFITTEKSEKIVDFEIVFENINRLQESKKFEFLIILDEFQEIHKIKKAEALLRGVLQSFSVKIPVIILGSKQHILTSIFENPKAPFYSWGSTVEFHPIPYEEYYEYIETRFNAVKKTHDLSVSVYLQKKLNHIPESINRFCNHIAHQKGHEKITSELVDSLLEDFVDRSRSIYEHIYSSLSSSERKIIEAIAQEDYRKEPTGKEFVSDVGDLSKSTIANLVNRLLDTSTISQTVDGGGTKIIWVTDPFFKHFVKKYKSAT